LLEHLTSFHRLSVRGQVIGKDRRSAFPALIVGGAELSERLLLATQLCLDVGKVAERVGVASRRCLSPRIEAFIKIALSEVQRSDEFKDVVMVEFDCPLKSRYRGLVLVGIHEVESKETGRVTETLLGGSPQNSPRREVLTAIDQHLSQVPSRLRAS
jgi:hypothetical protein